MSLFPAYTGQTQLKNDSAPKNSLASGWLENNSFAIEEDVVKEVQAGEANIDISSISSSQSSTSSSESQEEKHNKKLRKRKKKKKSKHKKKSKEENSTPTLQFYGDEDYYVDKTPAKQYKTIRTLHKPACPRYRKHYIRALGKTGWVSENHTDSKRPKRYYRYDYNKMKKCDQSEDESFQVSSFALNEEEYSTELGILNRKIFENPRELNLWLELLQLHEKNPYKWSRLLLAEKNIDILLRALTHHPRSEVLYRMYIETINATYPAFEVSKLLDKLLSKDPYNYTLWTAQIMATQGSMARCIVPDVLLIYERCMQKMHQNQQHDEIMLKLFNNCAMFLRQAGLYEQFFALLKLALELNVSAERFGEFAPRDDEQNTLIEYEELVLQSGLPMNEIWLRIEKLRQGFNFLPCPTNVKCSDPQRIVFNEDVCHYIYPMKSREKSFYLMFLVLRLLKLPFVQCDGLAEKFSARVDNMGDSDAIEDVLAVCVRRSYALPVKQQDEFLVNLFDLSKEMVVSPTFISNSIGFEIYVRCIKEMLESCATSFEILHEERKRIMFILLWCRFERLLLILQKYNKTLSSEFVKDGRLRFKTLLKKKLNRNVLNLYTEFALYEFESLDYEENMESVENIFENIIEANAADQTMASDLCHIYVTYAELLIGRDFHEKALQVLASYALGTNIKEKEVISTAKKLSALQKISEKCNRQLTIEEGVSIMVLEQYILPDYSVSLIKLRTYMLYLTGHKSEALDFLNKKLQTFCSGTSERHNYLRENIQELYVTLLQMPSKTCVTSNAFICTKTFEALEEYPRNLYLVQRCSMLTTPPWFKIRGILLANKPTIFSIIFLISLARYRFLKIISTPLSHMSITLTKEVIDWDQRFNELIVRNRILNVFQGLTPSAAKDKDEIATKKYENLQRNALFWRLYLRCISDQNTPFDTSKKCLLTALDECPWSKALYLDGATFVPQELSHLQDLIIEKQLRIYALPEELEILRE